jgi:hypothetical protein
VLQCRVGVQVECFASPLNCWNQRFCSVARDTDRFFGSLGNFFLFDGPTGKRHSCVCFYVININLYCALGRVTEDDAGLPRGGSFEANPPFVESVMNRMAQRIEWILENYPGSVHKPHRCFDLQS